MKDSWRTIYRPFSTELRNCRAYVRPLTFFFFWKMHVDATDRARILERQYFLTNER